jgi:hypothetical protein
MLKPSSTPTSQLDADHAYCGIVTVGVNRVAAPHFTASSASQRGGSSPGHGRRRRSVRVLDQQIERGDIDARSDPLDRAQR